jgi:hypothetical protein
MDMGMDMEENRGEGLELPRELANAVSPNMRQGLIIVTDPKDAEDVVRVFTGLIIDKDPYRIIDWRREYVTVSEEEFREELKLLATPLALEQTVMLATEFPGGRERPVIMRKIFIVSFVPPLSFIIFSQSSTALLVRDNDNLYLGFKGLSPETGNKVVVTIKSRTKSSLTVPFIPAVARFIIIGNIVEGIIDENGRAMGLR